MSISKPDPLVKATIHQPCPCMLNAAPNAKGSAPSLRVQAALNNDANYRTKYSLVPQSAEEWQAFVTGKFANIKKINKVLAKPGEVEFPLLAIWFKDGELGKSYQVFTSLFRGLGIAMKFMPGAETPVCDSKDFMSILNVATLTSLKTAGIDVIFVVVPDSIDVARAWGEKKLALADLSDLMPVSLQAYAIDAKLELHPDMPRIIMLSSNDLAQTNELGLVKTDGNRLGLTNERAFALYDRNGSLLHIEKAADTSLEMCAPVLGDKMLEKAQQLNIKVKPSPNPILHR